MKDIRTKVRAIRLEDKVWEDLKKLRKKSRLPWNLYVEQLIKQK